LSGPVFRLSELQARIGGRLIAHSPEVDSDPPLEGVASLHGAGPGQIGFVVGKSHLEAARKTRAGALIVGASLADAGLPCPALVVDNPHAAFARVTALFHPATPVQPGIHPSASIAGDARISDSAEIGPGVVVGSGAVIGARCRIGAGCAIGRHVVLGDDGLLHPQVTLYDGCRIGHRVILHSAAVIGADGFGFAWEDDHWVKVPQVGIVIIGDDVEIGAGSTVDRGALDDTVIEDGVKVDNQVQIAHNCHIGAHTAIAGCVGIAGSTHIGQRCRIGGGAVIMGHYRIADDVTISSGSFVAKDILQAGVYTSVQPIMPHADWLKNAAQLRHLATLRQRLNSLEKRFESNHSKD